MPDVSGLKKERKFRLAENKSRSHKVINKITKQTRKLQNDLISDTDWSTDNEYFTYKNRPFIGPSRQKLSNFLAQQNTDVAEDTNDYYQMIYNSFLLELMKQTICISCKSKWNGDMSVAKREGTVYLVFSHVKLNSYIYVFQDYIVLWCLHVTARTKLKSIHLNNVQKLLNEILIFEV